MPEPVCLICGQAHRNAITGGKVVFLRDCFRRKRTATGRTRNEKGQVIKTSEFAGGSARRMIRARKASVSNLQDALQSWGVSGGNGFGELELVE